MATVAPPRAAAEAPVFEPYLYRVARR